MLVPQPVLDRARRDRRAGRPPRSSRRRAPRRKFCRSSSSAARPTYAERRDATASCRRWAAPVSEILAAGEVHGKVPGVAGGDVERRGVHARAVVAHLEPGEAFAHVVGEVGLADLAVVDAVDTARRPACAPASTTSLRSIADSALRSACPRPARKSARSARALEERPGVGGQDAMSASYQRSVLPVRTPVL